MNGLKIIQEMWANLAEIVNHPKALVSHTLWVEFIKLHPADMAPFFLELDLAVFETLFQRLPKQLRLLLFEEFTSLMQVRCLAFMHERDRVEALNILTADELTDLFDLLSDDELKRYLELLHATARAEVLSLLKFHPESAGGVMDTRVFTLMDDFTVGKSIKLVQRLSPKRDIYRQLYVTNKAHRLVGYILLEDLVLHAPNERIVSFLRENEYVAQADEDQESMAKKMVHYGLSMVPVVGNESYFLGVISNQTLVDVLVEEATEDIQKMVALSPMKESYFQTPFLRLFYQRSYILAILLLAESFSRTILDAYEETIGIFLMTFVPMLISVGGNTSSQTSAMVIQGMATGDLHESNVWRFLKRELFMATLLALFLGCVAFLRVSFTHAFLIERIVVSVSLSLIVLVSVSLGGCIPLILKKLRLDPAFSAAPFLATIMDILGIFVYCYVSKLILG